MKLARRKILQSAVGIVTLPNFASLACAQTYPSRPLRIIVGAAPGGSPDIQARLIGQWLSERLGPGLAWLDELRTRDADGRFTGTAMLYMVAGTRPAQ